MTCVSSGGEDSHALATERSAEQESLGSYLLTSYEDHGVGEQIQSQWGSREVTLSWKGMQRPGGWGGARDDTLEMEFRSRLLC